MTRAAALVPSSGSTAVMAPQPARIDYAPIERLSEELDQVSVRVQGVVNRFEGTRRCR